MLFLRAETIENAKAWGMGALGFAITPVVYGAESLSLMRRNHRAGAGSVAASHTLELVPSLDIDKRAEPVVTTPAVMGHLAVHPDQRFAA